MNPLPRALRAPIFFASFALLSPLALGANLSDVSVSSGPVLVGKLSVQGNVDVSTHVILRGLELRPGKRFIPQKTVDGQQSLYASGCFEILDVEVTTPTTRQIDAVVRVKEREAKYVRGGVGYGTQSKERVSLGYEDHNFFGNLRQFDAKATYSGFVTQPHKYRTLLLETNLMQPYIFDTKLEGQVNLSEEWANREAYDSVATRLNMSVLRRFSKSLDARLRFRFSGTNLTRVSAEAETPDQTFIAAVGPTVTYDATNDRFLPTRGWRIIGTWEEGLKPLGSDVAFHKIEGRTGRFDTFSEWTFFEGLQAGSIFPHLGQSADIIPIYERYFIGGANTIRGYTERSLGPKDVDGNPLGGEAFLVANFEIRHPIYKKISGVLFIDGGQLYETSPGSRSPDFHVKGINVLARIIDR